MKITELFTSIQGEGKYQGRQCLFVRFPNCNLSCTECDTPYTWKDPIEVYDFELTDVIKQALKVNAIVFTGGEPLLPRNVSSIKNIIGKLGYMPIEIETNGTVIVPEEDLLYLKENSRNLIFNISPKINFTQDKPTNLTPKLIPHLQNFELENGKVQYIVKFLFNDERDLDIIKWKIEEWNIPVERVYVQPVGIDSNTLHTKINKHWDHIMREGWNISLRSHIFLFENKRNV